MKKFMRILVLGALAMSLVACSSTAENNNAEKPAATATAAAEQASEAASEEASEKPSEEASEKASEEASEKPAEEAKASAEGSTMKVTTSDAEGNDVEIEVPVDPKKVVTLDYVALDMLDKFGLGDRVVGSSKGSLPAYLSQYNESKDVADLGGFFEIDMEKLKGLEPDVIFTNGRNRDQYVALSEIAPVVNTTINNKEGFMTSFKKLMSRNASIFGKEAEFETIYKGYEDRVKALSEKAKGKTVLNGIVTGGKLNTLGNQSRGTILTHDIGFTNIAADVDSRHGNTVSMEYIVEKNPDYMFILDRDIAIGKEGQTAKQILDNDLIKGTKAFKEGHIVYVTPDVWYLAEGGIEATNIVLTDIESAFK